jgi:DDE domain
VFLVVFWRLRYTLSLRDLAELFLERGFELTHETVRAWEERFAPVFAEVLKAKRKGKAGKKWHGDKTFLKVKGQWCYLYRAIDQFGNLVDVLCWLLQISVPHLGKKQRLHTYSHLLLDVKSTRKRNEERCQRPSFLEWISEVASTGPNLLSETAREDLASENIRVITVYPGLTLTDFSKHSLGKQQVRRNPPAGIIPDTPEFVAQKILEAARWSCGKSSPEVKAE